MKLPFLSHSKSFDPNLLSPYSSSPWGFPSCGHLKTLSFRAPIKGEEINASVFLEGPSSPSRTFPTMSEEEAGDPIELVIQGLRSDRFFFEPEQSSSLIKKQEGTKTEENRVKCKESEMVWMDSLNPYEDFKISMEEMVKANGLMKDWEGLEELLGCYLKLNTKNNHTYILSAFIDLLVSLPFASSPSTITTTSNSSPSSPLSLTTLSLSSILDHHDDDDDDEHQEEKDL